MKLFIIAFVIVITLCNAEVQEPDNFVLLNPEFLIATSWAHQSSYFSLQDIIDAAFAATHRAIADELVASTSATITSYSSHSTNILNIYTPLSAEINTLGNTECRNNTVQMLESAVSAGGYRGGNCITSFAKSTQAEIDSANEILSEINAFYGQLPLNVYRAYVGRNAMVESERIESSINDTYAAVQSDWQAARPNIDQIIVTMRTNIAAATTKLNTCLTDATSYVQTLSTLIQTQIAECREFDTSNTRTTFKNLMPEFQKLLNTEEFVW